MCFFWIVKVILCYVLFVKFFLILICNGFFFWCLYLNFMGFKLKERFCLVLIIVNKFFLLLGCILMVINKMNLFGMLLGNSEFKVVLIIVFVEDRLYVIFWVCWFLEKGRGLFLYSLVVLILSLCKVYWNFCIKFVMLFVFIKLRI